MIKIPKKYYCSKCNRNHASGKIYQQHKKFRIPLTTKSNKKNRYIVNFSISGDITVFANSKKEAMKNVENMSIIKLKQKLKKFPNKIDLYDIYKL